MEGLSPQESAQASHYEEICVDYQQHYGDDATCPVSWTPGYASQAMYLEALLNPLLPAWMQCGVVCRWRKRSRTACAAP